MGFWIKLLKTKIKNTRRYSNSLPRQINHLHVYATVFFDDISITRLRENGHLDSVTWKSKSFALDLNYQVFNDIFLLAGYSWEHSTTLKHLLDSLFPFVFFVTFFLLVLRVNINSQYVKGSSKHMMNRLQNGEILLIFTQHTE